MTELPGTRLPRLRQFRGRSVTRGAAYWLAEDHVKLIRIKSVMIFADIERRLGPCWLFLCPQYPLRWVSRVSQGEVQSDPGCGRNWSSIIVYFSTYSVWFACSVLNHTLTSRTSCPTRFSSGTGLEAAAARAGGEWGGVAKANSIVYVSLTELRAELQKRQNLPLLQFGYAAAKLVWNLTRLSLVLHHVAATTNWLDSVVGARHGRVFSQSVAQCGNSDGSYFSVGAAKPFSSHFCSCRPQLKTSEGVRCTRLHRPPRKRNLCSVLFSRQ